MSRLANLDQLQLGKWATTYKGTEIEESLIPEAKYKVSISEIYGPVYQGEGPSIGAPTHFVRVAGCDFKCIMCDSMHAVDPKHPDWSSTLMTPNEIIKSLSTLYNESGVRRVTFSGGNPAIHQKLAPTIGRLHHKCWEIHVETQGSIWQDWLLKADSVVVSPKVIGMGESFDPFTFREFLEHLEQKQAPLLARAHINKGVAIKIVCFTRRDVIDAYDIFRMAKRTIDCSLFISQGNRYFDKSGYHLERTREFRDLLRHCQEVGSLEENRHLLNEVRVLPQLHVSTYDNERAR